MKNIYQETIEKVGKGSRFTVNFKDKSLKVDGKYIIKNGKYEGNLGIEKTDDNVLDVIETLYTRYYHSIPSARSDSKQRSYFRALPEHELSDEDMLYGIHREVAQVALELFVLCSIINGSLVWSEFADNKWFWQSQNYPSLIILKQWINNPKTNK